ncbi:hypothetical protein CHH67_21200 [Paenibacillus campinasensis]|uniref:Uncharacterized protein n=2 Tax=Paenibacillus campinasensis TaxID=66347 RepID=A0A268EIB7_9BACL|nr:hypothetical protein CHH67_21200 [Paenibacillus campinasensis]
MNEKLEIVKLGSQRFKTAGGYYQPEGYALRHPELGFLAFEGDVPYIPVGGRQALQEILDAGGLVSTDGCKWIQAM